MSTAQSAVLLPIALYFIFALLLVLLLFRSQHIPAKQTFCRVIILAAYALLAVYIANHYI